MEILMVLWQEALDKGDFKRVIELEVLMYKLTEKEGK